MQFAANGRPKAVNIDVDDLESLEKLKEVTRGLRKRTGESQVSALLTSSNFSDGILAQSDSRSQDKKSNRATMSTERIDYLIEDSGAGMRKDYAQYLVSFTAIH